MSDNSSNINDAKFRFLVVVDFSTASYNTLDYVIKLAKSIGGSLEVFHVSEPVNIIDSDNQVVVLRSINLVKNEIEQKLCSILEMIESEGIEVCGSYTFGVVEYELDDYLRNSSANVVVIANLKLGLMNRAKTFLVNEFEGNLLIINEGAKFSEGGNISLLCSNEPINKCCLDLVSSFSESVGIPISLLESENETKRKKLEEIKLLEKISYTKTESLPMNGLGVIEKVVRYANRNNVELICMQRKGHQPSFFNRFFKISSTLKGIKNIRTPLLLMGIK